MFRQRTTYTPATPTAALIPKLKTLETGEIETVLVDPATEKLPDPEMYDLELMQKAGVSLKQVSTILCNSPESSVVVASELDKALNPKTEVPVEPPSAPAEPSPQQVNEND